MATCPTCFKVYPDDVQSCAADGVDLVPDATFAHVDKDLVPETEVGEYRIVSKLGQGGFGSVYRAMHPLIGKPAAVKVLSREFSSNPQMVSRFIAEARAVNQIRHRNIIDIFSFGQLADGRQYYIMELLDGETFDAYLARRQRLSLAEAMPILRGIARALDAAHAKDILHRDLKPENVFLVFDEEGRVEPKLLDFGLVKLMADTSGHKTKTGTPMGTPHYMSPEQCRGADVDSRTDVYAFGALVFEVLTGTLPFEGESAMDILVKHMTAAPPSASERCPEVPPALDEPIRRMLAKDPNDRPARAGEAVDLLAQAAGLATVAPSSQPRLASGVTDARATARTMLADAPPPGAARAGAEGQTFLGAESDVAPPAGRSRLLAVAGVAAVVAVAAGALLVASSREEVPAASASQPSGVAAVVSAPPATSASAPPAPTASAAPRTDVELTVDGAPAGAVVSADGVELGPAPGPFTLEAGAPVKLTISAKGYKPQELSITPTEHVLVPVSLEKAPMAPAGGGHRPPKPKGGPTIHSDLQGFDDKK